MADFSSYPALDIQQMASPLDMAGKAAALNNAMLQNTGMGLEQHYTRLGAMARSGASLLNPDGTADPQAVKNSITDGVKNGILTASEGATALTSVPNDPKQAGQWLRQNLAGVANNLNAITPHMEGFDTGAGTVYRNTTPFAAGGNQTPAQITKGISPESATAITSWQDPATGKRMIGTQAQMLAALGTSGAPQVTPAGGQPAQPNAPAQPPVTAPGPTSPVATSPLPPAAPQIADATMAAIGKPNMLAARAPAPGVNMMAPPQPAVAQPVAGQGGAPMVQDPQQGVYQTANATNYQADVDAGSGPAMQTRIDNLHELAGTIDQAFTGAAQDKISYAQKLASYIGISTDGATASDVMHKLSTQAASYLPGAGQSDQARAAALGMTPNGDMTADAMKSTTAMVLGKAQYDAQFSKDAQAWKAAGGDATNDYASFKTQYADTHPGPMLYAAMAMRETGDTKGFARMMDYIKGLPSSERAKVSAQIGVLKGQINGQP